MDITISLILCSVVWLVGATVLIASLWGPRRY